MTHVFLSQGENVDLYLLSNLGAGGIHISGHCERKTPSRRGKLGWRRTAEETRKIVEKRHGNALEEDYL